MRGRATTLVLALWTLSCALPPRDAGSGAEVSRAIAFLAQGEGFWQAWVASPDGSGARQVTHSRSEKSRVSWFPDGRSLLVNSQEGEVSRVDLETGVEAPVPLPVRGMLDATLSPDGRLVAFSLTQSDSPDANELWVCDVDGKNLRQLTARAGLQYQPAWDSQGTAIYYLSSLGPYASHDIWRIGVDGSNDERLTFGELRHLDVAASATGDLAYSGNQSGSFDVWLKEPKLAPRRLTDDPAMDANPSFSPDGEAILFESSRGGTLNLWRVSRSGGTSSRVTDFAAPGARMPVWAPATESP